MRADTSAFCHRRVGIRSFHSFFYSFIYSLTHRQGSLPIDTLRQKSRFSGATSPPSQVPSTSKKPLGEVRLSPISTTKTAWELASQAVLFLGEGEKKGPLLATPHPIQAPHARAAAS